MKIDDLKDTFKTCMGAGKIREKMADIELAKSLKLVAEKGINFINIRSKDIPKDSMDWTFVFRDYYESLRSLIEAYLLLEEIAAENHQCLNSYICLKHPELELDWEFLETVRLMRNAINYRGQLLRYEDWKKLSLNFDLHIKLLSREIEGRLKI